MCFLEISPSQMTARTCSPKSWWWTLRSASPSSKSSNIPGAQPPHKTPTDQFENLKLPNCCPCTLQGLSLHVIFLTPVFLSMHAGVNIVLEADSVMPSCAGI